MARKITEKGDITKVAAPTLVKGDTVLVEEGEIIPSDGDIIDGTSLVDESAITGESAPVIRESGEINVVLQGVPRYFQVPLRSR